MNTTTSLSRPLSAALITPLLLLASVTGVQAAGPSVIQSADIGDFVTGLPVKGGGTLLRSQNSVRARLSTMGLDPGTAYTVWWVVFNRPSNCSDGVCGEDDFGSDEQIAAVGLSVLYADGFVTGTDGIANVVAELEAGHPPFDTDILLGNGLQRGNGLRAEIHMVIRSHGLAVVGEVDLQTSTFAGYCDVNVCADQRFIVFPPAL